MNNIEKKTIFNNIIYNIIDNKIDKITNKCNYVNHISYKDFNRFLNTLKLNNSIKTFKFSDKTDLLQDDFEKICKFIQNNKTIDKLMISSYD